MPTQRGTGLLVAAGVLWVLARSFGVVELQMAAVGALGLVGLGLAIVWLGPTRLRVRRRLRPDRIHAEEHARLELTVTAGRLPSPPLELSDERPDLDADAWIPVHALAPRTSMVWSTEVSGRRRGRRTLGPARVRLRDPFGVASRSRVLPGTSELVVYPRVATLPAGLALGGGSGVSGAPSARPRPTSSELADLREYVRGDDLRAVHWPSTAHRGQLMVRTGESPEDARAAVLLDRRAARHAGLGADASFETMASAAASVVRHLTDRGRAVALVHEPVLAPPEPAPWRTWLDLLAEIEPGEVDLPGLLGQLAQGVVGDGVLVAIVTPLPGDELLALVRAGRGFSTRVALVVDVPSHAGRTDPERRADHAVAGLLAAGWRVGILRHGDRIEDRWQQLVLAPRRAAG